MKGVLFLSQNKFVVIIMTRGKAVRQSSTYERSLSRQMNREIDATSVMAKRFSGKRAYNIVAEIEGKTWFQP